MWLASVIPWLFDVMLLPLPGLAHADTVMTLETMSFSAITSAQGNFIKGPLKAAIKPEM